MLVSLLNRTSGEVIKRKPRLVVCVPCACVMPWSICCVKCVCLWLFCLYRVLGLCIWFIASTPGLHVGVYVRVYQVLACWCVCVCVQVPIKELHSGNSGGGSSPCVSRMLSGLQRAWKDYIEGGREYHSCWPCYQG